MSIKFNLQAALSRTYEMKGAGKFLDKRGKVANLDDPKDESTQLSGIDVARRVERARTIAKSYLDAANNMERMLEEAMKSSDESADEGERKQEESEPAEQQS